MSDHERFKLRKQRERERQIRLQVYAEIDRLEKISCDNCRGFLKITASAEDFKCKCAAAVEIRKLTKTLSFERRIPNEMTIEIYHQLKEQKLSDSQIAENADWSLSKFNKWKRENGLVNA
ncbi:hypothetical protein FQ087_06160 [Sporosarcina sp. ANT_H38]|uniref:hypothetical protein n=1 Tax=Sporosarcina sp. ANT_H38 TaxID=2597358 RepID=UPI0011F2FA43|nr:hypothetical protein [Sporosarcina sp. ANT_H38]KAA0965848.1 hypothetical protein FQ087_06160 [Sporosarcina sp. ANT_H38]